MGLVAGHGTMSAPEYNSQQLTVLPTWLRPCQQSDMTPLLNTQVCTLLSRTDPRVLGCVSDHCAQHVLTGECSTLRVEEKLVQGFSGAVSQHCKED